MSDDTDPLPPVDAALMPAQAVLSDNDEVLYRQVHPDLFDGEQPSSSAFLPNPGDEDQLSTDRSSMATAQSAYELYVGNGRKSVGTFGITVGEFGAEELRCFSDPVSATEKTKANPAHARVDFSGLGTSKQRKVAKRLKQAAVQRGILFKP